MSHDEMHFENQNLNPVMWIDTNHKMIYTYPVKCFSCRNGSEERIDNRVKFPNGTAAVIAELFPGRKPATDFLGRPETVLESQPLLQASVRRPT